MTCQLAGEGSRAVRMRRSHQHQTRSNMMLHKIRLSAFRRTGADDLREGWAELGGAPWPPPIWARWGTCVSGGDGPQWPSALAGGPRGGPAGACGWVSKGLPGPMASNGLRWAPRDPIGPLSDLRGSRVTSGLGL
eukprot:4241695-Pyramimonas_sp.AAC.1